MPPRNREPGLGQMALPDAIRPSVDMESLHRRNSFAKAATPEYHGLFIDDYADLTPEQIAYVTPDFLEKSLLGASRNSKNTVYYQNPENGERLWVAVTPVEFKQTAGNIETLGNRAVSRALGRRPARPAYEVDRAAATQEGVEAVQNKLGQLTVMRDETLRPQKAKVKWLAHAAQSPGYAWKKGIDLYSYMSEVRHLVFTDMLTAMSIAGDWTPEKTEGVRKVVEYKLFFDREKNNHIENWKQMLKLADTYLGYKQAIYSEKIEKAKQYIRTNAESV